MKPIINQINALSILHSDSFLPEEIQKITWEINISPYTLVQRQPLLTLWYVIFQDHFILKRQKWDHYLHPVLRPAFVRTHHSCLPAGICAVSFIARWPITPLIIRA